MNKLECETNVLQNDAYQFYVSYMFYTDGTHNDSSTFEYFFRKNPFGAEYTIWAGLNKALDFLKNFKITETDINHIKHIIGHDNEGYYAWLKTLNSNMLVVRAIPEGNVVFPREPLITIEGPIGFLQLLETPLLVLFNYPTLICTLSNRLRRVIPSAKKFVDFGLRRAQGINGGLTGSVYAYMGGTDGTSNCQANVAANVPLVGTMSHAFITAFSSFDDMNKSLIINNNKNLVEIAKKYRDSLGFPTTNEGELASFLHYGLNYPKRFICLVDTYDTLKSGVPNYVISYLSLCEFYGKEYQESQFYYGIRLDSGDMAHLSKEARKLFGEIDEKLGSKLKNSVIAASDGLNEEKILKLEANQCQIDMYGVGTNLITCEAQPALGMVCKLVLFKGIPRFKHSSSLDKATLPGLKIIYRVEIDQLEFNSFLYNSCDILACENEILKEGSEKVYTASTGQELSIKLKKVARLDQVMLDAKNNIEIIENDINKLKLKVKESVQLMDPQIMKLKDATPALLLLTDKYYLLLKSLGALQ